MRNLYRISHRKHYFKFQILIGPVKSQTSKNIITVPAEAYEEIKLLSDNHTPVVEVQAFIVDQVANNVFYFSSPEGVYRGRWKEEYVDPFSTSKNNPWGVSEDYEHILTPERTWLEELLAGEEYRNIIAIEHLEVLNKLCCASADGRVWIYCLETGAVEEATNCSHGIEAMQWSPDQELVVFVDKQLNVVTMIGSEFEPINEVQLKDDTFGDRAFMSVGWGKKETQFRGSEGKAAPTKQAKEPGKGNAEKETQEKEQGKGQLAADEPDTCITWRADGEYFAVSFRTPDGLRAFKVFNKEGALQYTSERCDGLRAALAWQPSGQWIAVPQLKSDNKYVVALFEKNGLRHQEIPLAIDPTQQKVVSLEWSPGSEILAVLLHATAELAELEEPSQLNLYVMGNYHWYLKQCFEFDHKLYGIRWDHRASAGKTLHLLSTELCYERLQFEFRVDRSMGTGANDESLVAVIDGNRLLLTAFRRAIVPPPMCSYTLTVSTNQIMAVGFIRFPGRSSEKKMDVSANAFYVVDANNFISLYDVELTEESTGKDGGPKRTVISDVKVINTIIAEDLSDDFDETQTLLHCLWLNADSFVMYQNNTLVTLRTALRKSTRTKQLKTKIDRKVVNLTDWVGCVEASGPTSALIEYQSGRVLELQGLPQEASESLPKLELKQHSVLPVFCEQLFVDLRTHPASSVFAYSQARRNLYRNGTLLATDVTSVLLTEAYLLFTNISNLKFVPLTDDNARPPAIVGDRRLERGSKLVAAVSQGSRTVLQLPRGNLEAINPRVLSLCLIAKHLDGLEYFQAFDIMRKERINLNLLVDHNPDRFLAHLATHFLPQIKNVHWLNLFITDLAGQDVCRTMYESNYPGRQEQPLAGGTSDTSAGYSVQAKVQFICERLLAAMDSDPTVITLPKITCYVKQGQLESALALIWTLKQGNSSPEPAEEALRHLLYLVEVNVLYDVALGMYDFGLVLFVASKSQKDPKEYLPFLNELRREEENYRKYRIECHLKRYDRALGHIARCPATEEGRFEEALELIATHGLYTTGLECYRGTAGNEEHYRKICAQYGDHLRKGGKHAEASLMYERTGDIQQAISSARHALDWRRVLRLSARSADPDAARPVLRSLVPALVEAGEHEGAATIAHQYLQDARLAVDCLLKDHRYEQALLLVSSADREGDSEILEGTVREQLRQYLVTFGGSLATEKEQFLHQKGRLAVVREEREKARLAAGADGEEDGTGDCGDCDLFSENSTIASSSRHTSSSGRSGKSHRSSKNRRKHERKLLNLKEGNQYEDIALIDALHGLVLRICGVERQRHVRSICQVAFELGFDAEARTLQREYRALFQLVRYSLDAIWLPEMIVPNAASTADSGETGDSTARAEVAAIGLQTSSGLLQAQNAQRYALIKPHQRFKPEIQSISWQWDILK